MTRYNNLSLSEKNPIDYQVQFCCQVQKNASKAELAWSVSSRDFSPLIEWGLPGVNRIKMHFVPPDSPIRLAYALCHTKQMLWQNEKRPNVCWAALFFICCKKKRIQNGASQQKFGPSYLDRALVDKWIKWIKY